MYRIGLLLALCIFANLSACNQQAEFRGTQLTQLDWGGDFELSAHTGQRVTASQFQGKVVVLFFGFTHCPDICSPTLHKLAMATRELGPAANDLQVLFITIDPQRDDAKQLASFVPVFHPAFIGLTGSQAAIDTVVKEYKISAQSANTQSGERTINHTGGIFVKDRQGRLRLYIREGTNVGDIVHDLRLLLSEAT